MNKVEMDSGPKKMKPFWCQALVVDSCCMALSVGVVCGAPLTLLGELIMFDHRRNTLWTVIGGILALTGMIYAGVTGVGAMSSPMSMGIYFIAQALYFTVLALILRLLFLGFKNRSI